jgi:hypothetical protein
METSIISNKYNISEYNYENKSLIIAVYSTALLLYTFFNTFFLCYIGLNDNLDNTTLGLCIYFNCIFCIGFVYIFYSTLYKFLLSNLILYVINTSLAFIMLGIVHNNNQPIIINIVYGIINTLFISIMICKFKNSYIPSDNLTYSSVV